jgi:hypothetical protein
VNGTVLVVRKRAGLRHVGEPLLFDYLTCSAERNDVTAAMDYTRRRAR